MMTKKTTTLLILICLLSSILCLPFSVTALAGESKAAAENGMLNGFDPLIDAADILTDSEEEELFNRIIHLHTIYSFDVTILTMDEAISRDELLTFCDYYEALDPTRDGLVFGVNMNSYDRGYATSTRNFGQDAFTEAALDAIDSEIPDLLADGYYYDAMNQYLDLTEEFLTAAVNGAPYQSAEGMVTNILALFVAPLVIGLMFGGGIVFGIFVPQMKTAVIKTQAKDFMSKDSLKLTRTDDDFIRETVTRTARPKKSSSSSRGGYGGSRGGRSGGF